MKRLLCSFLAMVMIFGLTSCGMEEGNLPSDNPNQVVDLPEDRTEADSPGEPEDLDIPETPPEETPDDFEASGEDEPPLPEDGAYTTKEDVALYIHLYGQLPSNFITKKEAQDLGWSGGSLEPYAPGMCIGGNRFGNYEGLLPDAEGRTFTECDIDTLGANSRGAKRIVFSNDGLIYYTEEIGRAHV